MIGLRGRLKRTKQRSFGEATAGEETAAEMREGGRERAREEKKEVQKKNKAGTLLDRIEGDRAVINASKNPYLCSPTRAMVEEGDAVVVWEMGSEVGKREWE